MIYRNRYAMFILAFIVALLAQFSKPALAASNGILDVSVYHAPTYIKVELFEVGAPYPSRQNFITWPSYPGLDWYNLVTSPRYFVRVTNTKSGQQRQSFAFRIPSDGSPGAITVDWTSPNFVTWTHNLDY